MNQDISIAPSIHIYQGYVTTPVNIGVDVVNNDVIMGKINQNWTNVTLRIVQLKCWTKYQKLQNLISYLYVLLKKDFSRSQVKCKGRIVAAKLNISKIERCLNLTTESQCV